MSDCLPIYLTKGMVAYVSPEDHERVVAKRWQAKRGKRTWYARHVWREGKKLKGVYLHRFITGELDPGIHVDHRDNNGLNCTRRNLRSATGTENTRNRRKPAITTTSVYKGVSWVTRRRCWLAQIKVNSKSKHLGHFNIVAGTQGVKPRQHSFGDRSISRMWHPVLT